MSTPRPPRPPLRIDDLVHVPFKDFGTCALKGLDCWGLTRLVLGRLGVHLPADPAEALARELQLFEPVDPAAACREGDVLVLEGNEENGPRGFREHLGVALSAFQFVQATRAAGVRIDRIDVFVRARQVRRVLRPRGGTP